MLYKKIRNILMAALIIMISVTLISYLRNRKIEENKNKIESVKEAKAEETADDLYKKQEILNNVIKETNKVVIAEGNIEVKYLFSNTDDDLMIDDNNNPYKSLHEKLLKREIEYKSNYEYNYTYEMNNVETTLTNDKIIIRISEDKIRLEDITADPNKTKITENYGWIAADFTPKEIKAMEKRMYNKTYNYLITDEKSKEVAINSLKKAIEDICNKFTINNYSIKIDKNKTITNQDEYTEVQQNCINEVYAVVDAS